MALIVFRARVTVLTALLSVSCAPVAMGADMPFFQPPAPPAEEPVEFGKGWYLRGDVGYSNMAMPVVMADFVNNLGRMSALSYGVGLGYQFNSWFRADFTVDRSTFRPNTTHPAGWCPSGTVVDYPSGNTLGPNGSTLTGPAGYLYDTNEQCVANIVGSLDRITPMVNAYFDLGNWWGLTPYVGAGVGISNLQSSATVSWTQEWNGQPWAPNLGQTGVPLGWLTHTGIAVNNPRGPAPLPWDQLTPGASLTKRSWKFSWNLMAGVSYDVTQNVKLDLHYRFLNAGTFTGLGGFVSGASPVTSNLISQEVRLGLRLVSD